MSSKFENLLSLEQQISSVEADAQAEEQINAIENYARLRDEKENMYEPHPGIEPSTTGIDWEDIANIGKQKQEKQPYWEAQDLLVRYIENDRLHCGHLRTESGADYYFIDALDLPSRTLIGADSVIKLINVEDHNYAEIRRMWQFPSARNSVSFSRNITMRNFAVKEVDVKFDNSNQMLSGITDSYLRKALIRNKGKTGIQSIVQTIQQKQDDIRMLPASKSFIVQGCAGSGKTMVLLHRLRYLLYNHAIDPDSYLFLAPGNSFRSFVKDACSEFKINYRNVVPIQSYYQMVMGKPLNENATDVSELVFDSKYLARIYSKDFIRECYHHLFTLFAEQATILTDLCEECLGRVVETERQRLEEAIIRTKKDAVEDVRALTDKVLEFLPAQLEDYDSIPSICDALADAYYAAKEEYDQRVEPEPEIVISADDARIINHPLLRQLRNDIAVQKEKVKKALIFTVSSHRKKLAALEAQYQSEYQAVEQSLIEEDRRTYAERASQLSWVFEGVTIAEVEQILHSLESMEASVVEQLEKLENDQECMQSNLNEKHQEGISFLQHMIETSGAILIQSQTTVKDLLPSWQYFQQNIGIGRALLNYFSPYLTVPEKTYAKEKLRLFTNRTDAQLEAYLNTLLFNACKKTIKQEFGIKICDLYKHYWYLASYCQYLTRSRSSQRYTHLFIDEAQDLSVSELELIYKLNSIVVTDGQTRRLQTPRMNVFGDINQMITEHGIHSWDAIRFVAERYALAENFRNTNQIVDFCNQQLPIYMESVGVDMEAVAQYADLEMACQKDQNIRTDAVFIVKDEYAAADLAQLLQSSGIAERTIYTIKAVKGLEFREVYVFNRDMTNNEKYIAYTRALAKLSVITSLPHITDNTVPLYVQGEDVDDQE